MLIRIERFSIKLSTIIDPIAKKTSLIRFDKFIFQRFFISSEIRDSISQTVTVAVRNSRAENPDQNPG